MRTPTFIIALLLLPVLGATAQQAQAQATAPQPAAPTITLQQSIDTALANGDDNKILAGNLEVARAQHALNVSHNALTLGASAGYGQDWLYGDNTLQSKLGGSSGPTAGVTLAGPLTSVAVTASPYSVLAGTVPGVSTAPVGTVVGASVSQTLWNGYPGGPTQATVDKSLLTLQGKVAATDSGKLALIYRIKQAYYTMLGAQRNADLQRQILDKQNALLKQIQAIYDLKQASLVDLKTAQVNAQTAQVGVDSADNDLRTARLALAILMGMPPDSGFVVSATDDPTLPVTALDDAVAQALKRRVEIKQVELNIQSGNIDVALARGLATPTVSVTGGLTYDLLWGSPPTSAYQLSAGVKIAMPVLDAGAARNQADAAVQQNDVYAVQEVQLQKSITSDVRNAWAGWQLAIEKLDLAKAQADVSALTLEIYKTELANGTVSNQDLLTAAVNDATAQTALLSAQSAVQLAILQLLNVMGY